MKIRTTLVCYLLLLLSPAFPQSKPDASDYTNVIAQRAYKIVAPLGITDSAKFYRVQHIVMDQYRTLSIVHDTSNAHIKALKSTGAGKEEIAAGTRQIDEQRLARLHALHQSYLQALATELNPDQIIQVKDGMTYSVLPVTVKAYGEMLPNLTAEQKTQIVTYLTEAREYAMDAESSEKKHAWFGKYKGKINNYLSAAGYDMKKEGEEWQKRISAKKNTN